MSCKSPALSILLLSAVSICATGAASAQTSASSSFSIVPNGLQIEVKSGSENIKYEWFAPAIGTLYSMGTVVVSDSINGASPQGNITLGSTIDWVGASQKLEAVSYQSGAHPVATLTFLGPQGTTHLSVTATADGNFACLQLAADQPTIKGIHLGSLPAGLPVQSISVPYYSQAVSYLSSLELFENAYFDGFASQATTMATSGVPEAYYGHNDHGTTNLVRDQWKISVSKDIDSVLPYPEHPASPYRSQLAGRMMLDIRTGEFSSIAQQMSYLGDYGISHCSTLVQDWPHYGIDDGFPMEYPANSALGGDAPLKAISAAARANGCYFGLYENYTDEYPNYPEYNPATTMRYADDNQEPAWLNPVTGMQSYAIKPGLFLNYAKSQSPLIHSNYGTNATFIDVNSSAAPWWRADEDGTAPGSGMFATYRDASVSLWAYERATHGGPVFGEGKSHWFWSGLLDGVEAQFGSESTHITYGQYAPLFVDFDLTRIHPLQVNYGMGYYDRWTPGYDSMTATQLLDAYRMQEVIFGHNPYVTTGTWSSAPRALLEQELVSPLAGRYALQTPTAIKYLVNGSWGDASAAAKADNFSVAQVTYPNGDTIFANSQSAMLNWNSIEVPQWGWAAKGKDLLAFTGLVGGQLVDFAQTSQTLFANARNQADLLSENTLASPRVASFKQISANVVQLQMQWDVNNPQPDVSYTEFIHFVSTASSAGADSLAGQTSAAPVAPTNTWKTGEQVIDRPVNFYLPANMSNGTYQVRVGMFSGSQRATLYGNDDGTQRYTVGSITVANHGANITFTPASVSIKNVDPRLNSRGTQVNFGIVRTDGMVIMHQQTGSQSGSIQISAYPRSREVIVQINGVILHEPGSLTCDDGDVITPSAVPLTTYWQVDLRGRKYCTFAGKLP